MSSDLTSQTIKGIKWSYISMISGGILQLIYSSVMAHLLEPTVFGLLAIGMVVLKFGGYFAQMGIGRALIQKETITENDIKASFTSSLILGIIFCLIIFLSAPIFAYIFNNYEIENLIKVLSISFLFTGFSSTSISLLKRNLNFRVLARIEILSYLVSYALVGIPLAYAGYGVWSLVFASLSMGLITAVTSLIITKHTLSLTFKLASYKPLLSFGSKISFISILEFLGANFDTLFIGRMLGAQSLGLYNRAFMIINMPMQQFATSISKVLFSSFSRVQKEISRLKNAYLSGISSAGFILFPVCIGAAISAEDIVLVVLGEKWRGSVPILQILAIATPFYLLSHFGGIACEATSSLKIKIKLQVSYLIVLAVSFFFLSGYGLEGVAAAVLLSEFVRNSMYLFVIKKILSLDIKTLLNAYKPGLYTAFFTGGILFLTTKFSNTLYLNSISGLLINILTGIAALILLLFTKPNRNVLTELRSKIEKSFENKIKFENSFISRFLTPKSLEING